MITIQIDDKTYKTTEEFGKFLKNGIKFKCGYLEEVKENKDREQQTKDITGMLDLCMNVKPKFTPGQEVEVRGDGEDRTGFKI